MGLFTIRVIYHGIREEFVINTVRRFPLWSEVDEALRHMFNIMDDDIQLNWKNVLFFPSKTSNARIMFKRHVCDAAEYEEAQKPFIFPSTALPVLEFTLLKAADDSLAEVRVRREGRRLVKAAADLATEHQGYENELQRPLETVVRFTVLLEKATNNQDEDGKTLWSTQIAVLEKNIDRIKSKIEACLAEQVSISEKLNKPTLGYASFREYLLAEDSVDSQLAQDTLDDLAAYDLSERHRSRRLGGPSSSRASRRAPIASGSSPYPPLDHILSSGPRLTQTAPLEPPSPPEIPHISLDRPMYDFFQPLPPPKHIPRQPNIACALEAISSDFVPAKYRRDHPNCQPTRDMFHNPLDAPYQRLWNSSQRVANTLRDVRDLPPTRNQQIAAERRRRLAEIPRHCTLHDDDWEANRSRARSPPAAAPPAEPPVPPPFRHNNIACDGCSKSIMGFRFKCNQCADFDFCADCLMHSVHSGSHPVDHDFKMLSHERLAQFVRTTPAAPVVPESKHSASCDVCSKRINGIRFKCIDCPDWDCCETCSTTVNQVHPGHTFVKLNQADDLVEPPCRLVNKARHCNITCDLCNQVVTGNRWKCVHPDCPDYDLCDSCQASPHNAHPRRHPILKLSDPVNLEFTSRIRDSIGTSSKVLGKRPAEAAESPSQRIKLELPVVNDIGTQSDAMDVGPSEPSPVNQIKMEEANPGLIKCYTYEHVLAVCPPKPEEDQVAETSAAGARRNASPPTPATVVNSPQGPSPQAICSAVTDVTIPAGSRLPAGAEFTKTWTMQHFASGIDYTFDNLRLVLESGGLLGAACHASLTYGPGDIWFGQTVEVSLAGLIVPDMPDRQITEQWRFRDMNGSAYGEPLQIKFTVANEMSDCLSHSSFIMPKAETRARRVSRSPSLVWTIDVPPPHILYPGEFPNPNEPQAEGETQVEGETQAEDEFDVVERSNSQVSLHTSDSNSMTDDQLELSDSEFDFVDESEEESPRSREAEARRDREDEARRSRNTNRRVRVRLPGPDA